MDFELKMSIEGEEQLSRAIGSLPSDLDKLREPFDRIGKHILRETDKNFRSRGSRFGSAWPARKDNNPWPILEKTGKLRQGFRKKASNRQVEIDNPVDYFRYHQSNRPRSKLPRRKMLELTEPIRRQAINEIRRATVHILQRRGFKQ